MRLEIRAAFLLALCALVPLTVTAIDDASPAKATSITLSWGDENCDGSINALDTLTLLFQRIGGEPILPANCPLPGESVYRSDDGTEAPWGDMNCSGNPDTEEALFQIRFLLFGFTGPGGQCPAIGELVHAAT